MTFRHYFQQTIIAPLFVLVLTTPAFAREVAGVQFEEQTKSANTELLLNGAGIRTKLIFKVYAAGLYLPARSSDPEAILASTAPRRVVLKMLRDVDGETLLGALKEGLQANLSDAELGSLQSGLASLSRIFQSIGSAKSGDAIVLDFAADGITITRNGSPAGQVADTAMSRSLLKVWLGQKPVEASLKKALLGQ